MTLQELNERLQTIAGEIGVPCAYGFFREPTNPPFMIFRYEDRNDLYADNENFQKIQPVRVIYVSEFADFETEERIEDLLPTTYRKYAATWIESEKIYETDYEMEIILNG